jgi:hypothetical protein
MKTTGDAPKTGSSQWTKNERTINKSKALRDARDISQGLKPTSGISTGVNDAQYKAGYDKIKWTKAEDKPKPLFRTKVNGKYTDEE